jgi:hypothetical protein
MKRFIFIWALIAGSVYAVSPCSIARPELPKTKADIKAYMFVGEVIGYTDPVKSREKPNGLETEDGFYGEGRGVKIKPVRTINSPKIPKEYYELFKFGVTTWCADELRDLNYLEIGTKLSVVAYESDLLPTKGAGESIRLQSRLFDRFSIVKYDEFVTSETTEFDYKNDWRRSIDKFYAAKDYERLWAFYDFIYLETEKDLLRLENAKSKDERHKILERLLYNPKVDFTALISPALSRHNYLLKITDSPVKEMPIQLTSIEKGLLERRQELETSDYFRLPETN